jgi:hypothetical protein
MTYTQYSIPESIFYLKWSLDNIRKSKEKLGDNDPELFKNLNKLEIHILKIIKKHTEKE